MYYLIDIVQAVCLAKCKTRTELHAAWLQHAQRVSRLELLLCDTPQPDFSLLSMTDGDTVLEPVRNKYICRPLRVVDEKGRTVDIRLWPEMYEALKPKKSKDRTPSPFTGSKHHEHRTTGPAMLHQTLKQSFCTYDLTEEEEALLPEFASVKPMRKRFGVNDSFEKVERRWHNKQTGSKSWKDQSKSQRQYTKHKPKPFYKSLKQAVLDPDTLPAKLPIESW